jgi:hypothetical protein
MSFLQELEVAVSGGSAESRRRALWYATDLLITGRYTDDEIWMFGEVIGRLEQEIEVAARAQLAKRLARTDNAPIGIINKLAFDDSIDVAGPVLRHFCLSAERVQTVADASLAPLSKAWSPSDYLADYFENFVQFYGYRIGAAMAHEHA